MTIEMPSRSGGDAPNDHAGSDRSDPPDRPNRSERGRRWGPVVGGLAALATALVATVLWLGEDGPTGSVGLALGSEAATSCLAFDQATLAGMPTAFAGEVAAVDGEVVTLSVDRWYAGGDGAELVLLEAPTGMEALIGGIPFEVGGRYLITATGGVVNYCGYSGPATPDLTARFDAAFGS